MKIAQNIPFEFFNFGTFRGNICLVTLFDLQLHVFSKTKIDLYSTFFFELLSTQNVEMRHFL